MAIGRFIFSEEGALFLDEFKNKFGCRFRYDEPGNDLVFDVDEKTYKILDDETLENFKSLILDSVKKCQNLLAEQCNIVEYEDNIDF